MSGFNPSPASASYEEPNDAVNERSVGDEVFEEATDMKRTNGSVGLAFMALVLAVFLLSCTQGNPPGVSGFSKGVITAKGSIFVNGVEFDLSGASIQINGVPGTDADLRVGMQVEVKGKIDDPSLTGTAAEVHFDGSLKGPISDPIVAPNLKVLGQTVITDTNTVFESLPLGIASLAQNDVIEVAGMPDASGQILATHIEETGSSTYEIVGVVSSPGAGTFVLTPPNNGVALTVNYTGSLAADIVAGTTVEVKFSTFSTLTITTTAANIEAKAELQPAEGERVEVQGFVTGLSGSTFSVEGISVNAGSLSLAGISNGTKVEVEGTFTSGVLYAEKIQIK
jgi:hypothetical protein